MDSSTDEYFGTLGGSLMKDLLADLQVDDNDWSLEQLEKELASLDQEPSLEHQPMPSLNAASLVVSHAQERTSSILSMLPPGTTTGQLDAPGIGNTSSTDAWSLSLQKFTSLSLQDDFLAADTARKQTRPPPGMASLAGAEDYDIKEKQVMAGPPGLPPGIGGGGAEPSVPPKQDVPISSQNNSLPVPDEMREIGAVVGLNSTKIEQTKKDIPMAATTFPANNAFPPANMANMMPPQGAMPPQGTVMPPPQMQGGMMMPQSAPPNQFMPPQGMIPGPHNQHAPPPPMAVPMQMPMPMQMQMPMNIPPTMATPITAPLTGVVVGAAVSTPGPAWQTPRSVPLPVPQQQQPPSYQMKAFCNPYPTAPPIPATALVSSCMSSRDIAYVVHAILKPVLAEGISENDYYIQYIKRRVGGPQANPINPKIVKDASHDMTSRQTKSKEWASEKSVLGHVTKSNVARPRALIATPQPTADQDNKEQRQRANLWKARVYCDQAYQSYQNVIDIWLAAPPGGGIPPQVQLHLMKLMKCMGIVLDNEKKVYIVSNDALKLIIKLEKGRTLLCRLLEQALLPPNAVQALLPALLEIIISIPMIINENKVKEEEKTVARLFLAITSIVPKLNINGDTLVKCMDVVLSHGQAAICSPVRMGCVLSLLQKGAHAVPQDQSEDVKEAWGIAERKFTSLIQGA